MTKARLGKMVLVEQFGCLEDGSPMKLGSMRMDFVKLFGGKDVQVRLSDGTFEVI